MEASPAYPQLADGLEIGAVYEYKFEESSWYRDRSKSGYHVALFCEALVSAKVPLGTPADSAATERILKKILDQIPAKSSDD
ncbi:hypothetical protein D9M69_585710 [compost metagenome]